MLFAHQAYSAVAVKHKVQRTTYRVLYPTQFHKQFIDEAAAPIGVQQIGRRFSPVKVCNVFGRYPHDITSSAVLSGMTVGAHTSATMASTSAWLTCAASKARRTWSGARDSCRNRSIAVSSAGNAASGLSTINPVPIGMVFSFQASGLAVCVFAVSGVTVGRYCPLRRRGRTTVDATPAVFATGAAD